MTQPNELVETIEKALAHRHTSSLWDAMYFAESENWLRALLEENKRLTTEVNRFREDAVHFNANRMEEQNEHLDLQRRAGKEIIRINILLDKLREELEQVKAERDELKQDLSESEEKFGGLEYANIDNLNELESLRTELSAKDKVLEWYAYEDGDSSDGGDKARTILSQYPPRREEDET